jgi:hypothetical protein
MIYGVVMLDNRHRVIGALEVDESPNGTCVCDPIFLHSETSYVALTVKEVNGKALENTEVAYYLLRDVGLFALSMAALSFLEAAAVSLLVSIDASAVSGGAFNAAVDLGTLIGTAVLIGVISVVILLIHCSKKDVRILLHD